MTKKGYLYDGSLCIACRACQVACKQWNQLPAEKTTFFAAGGGYQNPPDLTMHTWNLIKFHEKDDNCKIEWLFRRHACNHCTEAACIEACPVEPVKAMTRHPIYGTVYVNQDLCIGCGSCAEACPFSIPHVDENLEKSFKCWACLDRLNNGKTPACVNTCSTDALQFGDRDQLVEKAEARLAELQKKGIKAFAYGLTELGGLGKIFILPGEPKDYDLPVNPQIAENVEKARELINAYKEKQALNPTMVKRAWDEVKKRYHLV